MDLLRVVTFSPGGRPVTQKDLETGVFYGKARDSFQVQPGDKHQIVVGQNRRFGGGNIVGEAHDNWSASATWLIQGTTPDNCLTNLSTFLAQLETLPIGDRFLLWQPDGASFPIFFEIRGTAKWNPNYSWALFAGADAIQVEVSFPIAPLARGHSMDIWDPFDVDSKADYTFDAGAVGDVSVDTTNQVLTAAANLTVEKRMVHTARGYSHADGEISCKTTPGATITNFKASAVIKRVDANNYVEAYLDDNGTNSRVRIDVIVAGVRTNRATSNLPTRITNGSPMYVRGRMEGNNVIADVSTGEFMNSQVGFNGTTTSTSYLLATAEANVLGSAISGKGGIAWIPQDAAATLDDVKVMPFTYDLTTQRDFAPNGSIPGDAPALVSPSWQFASSPIAWMSFGWLPASPVCNLCWNGSLPFGTQGWSIAAVTNINGAATSITRNGLTTAKYPSGFAMDVACPATAGTGINFALYRLFRKGVTYTFDVWVKSAQTTSVSARLGNATANDVATSVGVALSANYQQLTIQWTPTADRANAHLAVIINAATLTTVSISAARVYEGTTPPTLKSQVEGMGAPAPFGYLQAEHVDTQSMTNFAVSTGNIGNGPGRAGSILSWSAIGALATGLAKWWVDPNLLVPDDFSGNEVQVEVYARMLLSNTLTSCTAVLSARPQDVNGLDRYTAEYGSSGKPMLVPKTAFPKLYRLGTLTFTVDRDRPRVWCVQLSISAAGSASSILLDELLFLPGKRRAASATGKSNDSTYPLFFQNGLAGTKSVAPDLSGSFTPLGYPYPAPFPTSGLGGSLIEFPPGKVQVAFRGSYAIADEITTSSTDDTANSLFGELTSRFRLCVTPRWQLARDA